MVLAIRTNTQNRLIEIATPLFAIKGYAAVSVREVTDAADINVSAISYHFNGKEGLYQAVLEEQLSPLLEAVDHVKSNSSLSPEQRLTFYAERVAHIHSCRPYLSRFMISESMNPTAYGGPIIECHLSQVYQFINGALQMGMKDGTFQTGVDIKYAAVALTGILNFYFIAKPMLQRLHVIDEDNEDEFQYTADAFRIYLEGIVKK
jgi:Transcriptional regulator